MDLIVGARQSPLSKQQVQEVLKELQLYHPDICFHPKFLESTGDKDQKTSLRELEKTNFFTKEIDDLLLANQCRIAIHSAKDLPDPLPHGLCIIAITKGLDPSDSLVFREGEDLYSLPSGSIIATSSLRREGAVKSLRSDLQFQDIRGTIDQRLQKLAEKKVDGVVIAEAALIRLNLQHLNRLKLSIETTPLQGKLAILARDDDKEMKCLFSCLDSRKSQASLYLGIELPFAGFDERKLIHKPIISVVPKCRDEIAQAFQDIPLYTHLIFTSKSAVRFFFQALPAFQIPLLYLNTKIFIAVGQSTQSAIEAQGFKVHFTAKEETSEGVVAELDRMNKQLSYFFWPHSNGSRPVISNFLQENGYRYKDCVLYSTIPAAEFEMPDSSLFDEIIFTSPSTVEAFFLRFPNFREKKIFTSIGPITESSLAKYRLDQQK